MAPWVADDCVDTRRKVLLVSGSLRAGSTNSALLRTAVRVAPAGVEAELFDGVGRLPHFDPDQDGDPLHPAVEALRAAIRGCGSILFSTLEYAGALPGAFKNLLEWAVGDADVGSIYDKRWGGSTCWHLRREPPMPTGRLRSCSATCMPQLCPRHA